MFRLDAGGTITWLKILKLLKMLVPLIKLTNWLPQLIYLMHSQTEMYRKQVLVLMGVKPRLVGEQQGTVTVCLLRSCYHIELAKFGTHNWACTK